MGAKMSKKRKGRGDADDTKAPAELAEPTGGADGSAEEAGSRESPETGDPDETVASEATDKTEANQVPQSASEDAAPAAGSEAEAVAPEGNCKAAPTQTDRVAAAAGAVATTAAKELGEKPRDEQAAAAAAAEEANVSLAAAASASKQPPGSAQEARDTVPRQATSPDPRGGETGRDGAPRRGAEATQALGEDGAVAAGSPPGLAASPGPAKPQVTPSRSAGSDAGTFAVRLESSAEPAKKVAPAAVEAEEVWVRRDAVEATHGAEKSKRNSRYDNDDDAGLGDSAATDPILPLTTEFGKLEPNPPQPVSESHGRGTGDKCGSAVAAKAEEAAVSEEVSKTAAAIPSPSKSDAELDSVRANDTASAPGAGEKVTSPRGIDRAQTAAAELAIKEIIHDAAAKPEPQGSAPQPLSGVTASPATPDGEADSAALGEGIPASAGSRAGEQAPPSTAPTGHDDSNSQAPEAASAAVSATDVARTNGALDNEADDAVVSAGTDDAAAALSGGAGGGGASAGDTNGHHRCDGADGTATGDDDDDGGGGDHGVRAEGDAAAPAEEAKAVGDTNQMSPQVGQVIPDGGPKAPSRSKGNRGAAGEDDGGGAEMAEAVGGDGLAKTGNLIEF